MENVELDMIVSGDTFVATKFWYGKKVFLTGHTGFKGSWLSLWLSSLGAKVFGYSLPPNTTPNLFEIADVADYVEKSYFGDVRDFDSLRKSVLEVQPEILIHMAAQPLVRYSYESPIETYSTNLMGTVNFFEAIKCATSAKSVVIVTSDKCYENKEWIWGYRENEPMGGVDPYSSSKGCAELIVNAYRHSFFSVNQYDKHQVAIASARAGNVIGGGDWAKDRLIVDAVSSFSKGEVLKIRNPHATRPWQHVLEPLSGYLMLAQGLYEGGIKYSGGWNFGPHYEDVRSVGDVMDLMISKWGGDARWVSDLSYHPHEACLLSLDCSKAHAKLGWHPKWNLSDAIESIIEWNHSYNARKNMREVCLAQILKYQNAL